MPKPVFIESRNLTANFPDDATQEEINAAIVELFPRNGQDVAYDLSKFKEAGGKDSEFIANISDDDYIRLNNYRADKKLSTGEFFGIAGEALGTIVGDALGGLKAAVTEAGEGVLESAARGVGAGTVDLVNLGQKLITPNQRIPSKDEFLQQPRTVYGYAYGPGGPSISQVPATERDYQTLIDQERAMELQSLELAEVSQDLIEGAPVPEVAKGASYIDALTLAGLAKSIAKAGVKSVFKKTAQAPITTTARPLPGVAATIETGESVIPEAMRQNAEAFAAKVGEGAKKAGFTGVQFGAGAVKKTADLGTAVIDAANKIGLGDTAIRGGIGAAIGYQEGGKEGALQGALGAAILPKLARGGLRAVSGTADFIGAAAKVGKSGQSRTGIFERMAQAADISPQARNFAEKVLFTQPFVQATGEGLRQAATRSLIGAPVGAALGYAADGPEGAAAGLGAGIGISILGGALDTGIDSIKTLAGKSTARSQRNAIGDIRSFVNAIPDDVARTGYAELMDKAIKIAGPERAADMLDSLRIAEGMGASVEIVPPSQRSKAFNAFDYSGGGGGKIIINPDRMNAGSVAHETFHQFFNVGLKTELQQALRDLYLGRKDADGNVIQQGLWDDAEFSNRAAELAERYKDNPKGYEYALKQADILKDPAGFSPEAIDQARMFIIDEMTAEYAEAFMGRSRPGTFNPDRLPLWHRQMLQRMDDIILNRISDKVYGDRNIKDPTAPFTDENGKPIRVPQLDSVLKRAWSNKMSRERGQTAGKIGKSKEVVIPTKPRDLIVFAQATFGATRDILGSDDQGNPRILTNAERKQQAKADFEESKALYQTLSDDEKSTVRIADKANQTVDINSPNAQIRITSQTPEPVFEKFLQVAKDRGMGNQQISHMRQLFASMAANEGPTFNTVNNPVYKFNKRTGQMRAELRPPTRQEIYPLAIRVNSAGGFNIDYIDMSRVKANAQKILDNPEYKGIWNGMDDFMNDFKRSLRNLSAEKPAAGVKDTTPSSAEILGNGNTKIGAIKRDLIAEAMNVTLPGRLQYANQPVIDPLTLASSAGKERRVGGSAIRDFRIERLTEVIPTNERMKVVQENAYDRLVSRYQPSAFARETLPNGEAMTNPDGYRILKKTGGKLFRVYDDKGELIGTASTETAAMKKAQSDAAKKMPKEDLTSTKRFQPEAEDAVYRKIMAKYDGWKSTDVLARKPGEVNPRPYSPIIKDLLIRKDSGEDIPESVIARAIDEHFQSKKIDPNNLNIPSQEKVLETIDSRQRAEHERTMQMGIPEPGTTITVRQDVPSHKKGVGVTTTQIIKDGKKSGTLYFPSVRYTDPVFGTTGGSEKLARSIAKHETPKTPAIKIDGNWSGDQSIPADLENWTQVGFNPDRHSYYYEKGTNKQVFSGDEAFQIGNTVFVRNPNFEPPAGVESSKFRFQPDFFEQKGLENHELQPILGKTFNFNSNKINEEYIKQAQAAADRLGNGSAFHPSRASGDDGEAKRQMDSLRSSSLRKYDEIEARLLQDSPNGVTKEGGEHFTFVPDNKDYVVKVTKPSESGTSGFTVDEYVAKGFNQNQFRFLNFRHASVSEYVARTALFSKLFNIPWQVVEVAQAKDGTPVIYSLMKKIEGDRLNDANPVDRKAVEKLMTSKGFEYLGDNYLTFRRGSEKLEGITFFNPKTGVLISDAEPRNFVRTKAGKIEPVDLMINVFPTNYDIRYQPDAASPSILNGINGTRIIKSPSGKFRVYSVTGTLLGIRDTEQAAKKLGTK